MREKYHQFRRHIFFVVMLAWLFNSFVSAAVQVANPVANAGGPYRSAVGVEIVFDGSKSVATTVDKELTFAWDFGDQSTGSLVTPVHTYSSAGIFTAKLTVTDSDNASATVSVPVVVWAAVFVPCLVGMNPVPEASELLRAGELNLGEVIRQSCPSCVAPGLIVDQLPRAGSIVARGSLVNVMVSNPTAVPPFVTVPNVTGQPFLTGLARLLGDGLTAGNVQNTTGTPLAGTIISSQSPSGGAGVLRCSRVDLMASPSEVAVPALVGLPFADGVKTLLNDGLRVGNMGYNFGPAPPAGAISSQTPLPGTMVPVGSPMGLYVSAGLDLTVARPGGPYAGTTCQTIRFDGLQSTGTKPGSPLHFSWDFGDGSVGAQNSPIVTHSYTQAGTFKVSLTVTDSIGAQNTATTKAALVPPDPSTVAPKLDRSVTTIVGVATSFLYSGNCPIQTGVAAGTIVPTHAAVLRGKVLDKTNAPLPGVTITILNHPEFGQTLSRMDGMFDLAVNGGSLLTLHYAMTGFLPAQRQINVLWQHTAIAPDVILMPPDTQVTTLDLTSQASVQVARGTMMHDTDGTRQATLLVPQGTQATMVMPDGSTRPLTTLSVRATEFTVDTNGPQAMPAELPPASAYTYAVELSADEEVAAGARQVRFSQPLPLYVENFLNFPVGTEVPLGSYDKALGMWVASDNARVLKIISITGGAAQLDTGSGTADNGVAIGVTSAERQKLASLYAPGQSLCRMAIDHFSDAWDPNCGFGLPADGKPYGGPGPKGADERDDACKNASGSIIEPQNQALGETIPVTGTPFSLNYRSDRVPGRKDAYTLIIPLSGASIPQSLKQIILQLIVAGKRFTKGFIPPISY
jgi:beta-lactam-binding protein with PASTA domain